MTDTIVVYPSASYREHAAGEPCERVTSLGCDPHGQTPHAQGQPDGPHDCTAVVRVRPG